MYEIIYVIQTVAQAHLPFIYCVPSGLFLSGAIIICGQYDILFCSLKNLLSTAMIRKGAYQKELS